MTGDPRVLLGRWTLRRWLVDRAAGVLGSVDGELVVADRGGRLSWTETGTLRWSGRVAPVSRVYGFRPGPDGWWLTFADGRDFHPWRPGEPVTHPCRADTYAGLVVLDPDGRRMRTRWDVRGPAKDQRIVTRFTRA